MLIACSPPPVTTQDRGLEYEQLDQTALFSRVGLIGLVLVGSVELADAIARDLDRNDRG